MTSIAAQLLHPNRILLDLTATDKNEAILEVAGIVRAERDVTNFGGFCEELLARDELRSTAAGYGVAFPHARTDAVRDLVIAAGRSAAGVRFGGETVNFIFVIGTPREKVSDYLVVVGGLARALRAEKTRVALAAARTPEEFITVLGK
ncbi:MAG TPA: PTS sugar transporter subunit IIA [Chthoniobacteraceae bacterium]|jgi:mannitol/fructose-specific phosphotransferase system IIA component (Ntr-type)|nr:PTS sugar transporter subunit IIA [Chthoniobacteraceae bacterium]